MLFPLSHSNDLEWKIGDYWKYEVTSWAFYPGGEYAGDVQKVIMEYKVIGKENVTFHDKSYYAYRVEGKIYYDSNLTENFTEFYMTDDLSYLRGWYPYRGGWLTYDPPMERFKFLEVGKKWNQSVVEFYNGSFWEENTTLSLYYECIGKENIKTMAGDFECYIITENYGNIPAFYQLYYFSPSVKNIVLSESYFNGKIGEKKELISTSYTKKPLKIIFIPIVILLVLLFIVYCFWWKYKRY